MCVTYVSVTHVIHQYLYTPNTPRTPNMYYMYSTPCHVCQHVSRHLSHNNCSSFTFNGTTLTKSTTTYRSLGKPFWDLIYLGDYFDEIECETSHEVTINVSF